MNKLTEFFNSQENKHTLWKFPHYLEIYDRHFNKFKNPTILEIGVYEGGSIETWNHYFDNCSIYGVDINPSCKYLENDFNNVKVFIGDQADDGFWQKFKQDAPLFDIIIDDGSHQVKHQITTFNAMYEHMTDDSVYLCEDTSSSYKSMYGGKLGNNFVEYIKGLIDSLHGLHCVSGIRDQLPKWRNSKGIAFPFTTNSIHFYDGVVVLEKRKRDNKYEAVTKFPPGIE